MFGGEEPSKSTDKLKAILTFASDYLHNRTGENGERLPTPKKIVIVWVDLADGVLVPNITIEF